MSENQHGLSQERTVKVMLSEDEIVWLIQMMAQVKVNTTCPHCEDEAIDKGILFLSVISPEAREMAMAIARKGAERVIIANNAPESKSIN